jgi:hypothetical protein
MDNKADMFSLTGTSSGFESRAASIFSALDVTADRSKKQTDGNADADEFLMPPPRPIRTTQKEKRLTTKVSDRKRHFRDLRPTPDHVLHPERWQKYSLEDTELSSDSQNKQAAFAFLAELRERKSLTKVQETEFPPKFVYRKQSKGESCKTGESDSVQSHVDSQRSGSGKTVLKEYVVGASQPRKRKTKSRPCDKDPTVTTTHVQTAPKLSHLEDEDDDDT